MKLIDREPTLEMIGAARFYKEGTHTLACAWRAMYDAAPEVNGQAEITKRDARIAELEADQDKANAAVTIGNYLGKTYNYAWCDTSLASQTIDLLKEQAAEISRLKGVIAKCTEALTQCRQWKEGANTLTCHNHEAVEEALAAIKEEGNEPTD